MSAYQIVIAPAVYVAIKDNLPNLTYPNREKAVEALAKALNRAGTKTDGDRTIFLNEYGGRIAW